MEIETLDHVALWVEDRDAVSAFLTAHVGMHVIDRTERFTLVGSDARRGKLTLFPADGPRDQGVLWRVGLSVSDLDRAVSALPPDLEVERTNTFVTFVAPGGLRLSLLEQQDGAVDYDIDHVAFVVRDPEDVHRELTGLGFGEREGELVAGSSTIKLLAGDPGSEERPLLHHLGLRVKSAEEHIVQAREMGLEIADIVDAPNTYAVFVWGPERIKLEYVEHKPSFSLV